MSAPTVIVGGGIAGLYAAWRLKSADPQADICLIEATGRLGGRIRSHVFPGHDGPAIDLGATAFGRSQRHVAGLVRALGLAAVPYVTSNKHALVHLRGRAMPRRQVGRYGVGPAFRFDVPVKVQRKGGARPLLDAAERLLPGCRDFAAADWSRAFAEATLEGVRLAEWPLEAALRHAVSSETIAYVEGRLGSTLQTRGGNALAGLVWIVEQSRLPRPMLAPEGGYPALTLALERALRGMGVPIATGEALAGIGWPAEPGGSFRLRLRVADSVFRESEAASLVLALPASSVAMLVHEGPAEAAARMQALAVSVAPLPAGRLALLFADAWWRGVGIGSGYAVTDQPLQQVWAEPGASGAAPSVVSAYFDGPHVGYWREAAGGPAGEAGLTLLAPGHLAVREAVRQLGAMLGRAVPAPVAACFQDWGAYPFGAAIHKWARGVDPFRASAEAVQPVAGHRLFLCGEAWSPTGQGWVEGALERAEAVLQAGFGLPAGPGI